MKMGIGHTIEGKQSVPPDRKTQPRTPIRLTAGELEALDWGQVVDFKNTPPTQYHDPSCPRHSAEGAY